MNDLEPVGGEVYMEGMLLDGNLPRNFDYASYPVGGFHAGGVNGVIGGSLGHNLSSDGSAIAVFIQPTDLNSMSALLGSLDDHAGFTETIALLPGSPAIDRGSPTSTLDHDQRNQPRPLDGDGDGTAIVDIGAYEYFLPGNGVEFWKDYE